MNTTEKNKAFTLARVGGQNDKAITAMMNEVENIMTSNDDAIKYDVIHKGQL